MSATASVSSPPTVESGASIPVGSQPAAPRRALRQNTPGRLRLYAILLSALIVLAGIVALGLAAQLVDRTAQIDESTGPVLIETQEMFASLAEADAAATAVHLSGASEDREQRQLYLDALDRTTIGLENVAHLVGDDDESHRSLQAIASLLVTYSGVIENARVSNREGLPGADGQLTSAISIVRDGITQEVNQITERAQERLTEESESSAFLPALAALLLAAILVAVAHVYITRRFRRILNLPLLASGIVLLALLGWLTWAFVTQQSALDEARQQAYESISVTADIQAIAFRYKADEALALIQGDAIDTSGVVALSSVDITEEDARFIRNGTTRASEGLIDLAAARADSGREQAGVAEMAVRWQRYVDTSRTLADTVAAGQSDEAIAIATGPANSTFNGFNTAVESVLAANRSQFEEAVDRAGNALRYLQLAIPIGTLIAALLAWWGFSLRIREYQ